MKTNLSRNSLISNPQEEPPSPSPSTEVFNPNGAVLFKEKRSIRPLPEWKKILKNKDKPPQPTP